jgi:hypothetical protein
MTAAKSLTLPRWFVVLIALVGAGCQHDRHSQIPADATLMTEGDKSLSFRANESGTVYVYNRNDDKMVYSGDIGRGETLSVDSPNNRITLDGRTVLEKGVDRNETLRVFFKPNVLPRERVIVEEPREVR